MSSGFSGGGVPDFFTGAGRSATPMNMNGPPQLPYRTAIAGVLPDQASQIVHRGTDFIGKRSLAEFQQQQQLLQQQQQQQLQHQHHQQQMGGLGGIYNNLRNVKPRVNYQHASPISPLSPVDLSVVSSLSSDVSSSISNSSSPMPFNSRYGLPILQQFRPQQHQQRMMSNFTSLSSGNIMSPAPNKFVPSPSNISSSSSSTVSFPNLVQNQRTVVPMPTMGIGMGMGTSGQQLLSAPQDQTENKMMNRLQELEKQLLDDDDDNERGGGGDAVSVVTNSEWSDTIHNLNMITTNNNKAISPSPTSSSSSCSSTSASPPITCPKQSITDAATAISEGRTEAATEILTRLSQVSNAGGTPEQRLTAYMTSALRSRVNPTEYPPPVCELYNMEHAGSTQMLFEVSPCFKLGFMAANLAILEAISGGEQVAGVVKKLHVIDFDIGEGGQYMHLLHALGGKKGDNKPSVLKITTLVDFVSGGEEKLRDVGDGLKRLATKIGVCFSFQVMSLKICELSRENLGVESDEALAVNFAFRLYRLPDESVTTENLRDELLRRVRGLSPKVVTVVEQEMNANTAPFVARVNEACGYYGVLFESLEATVPGDHPDRVRIDEGLGRKMANSVACEGRDRVERCEVFGKWRARMGMAGFQLMPMSALVADSLRSKLNSGARGNPGFTVTEQSGGICFGWMGRTLSVASAWR